MVAAAVKLQTNTSQGLVASTATQVAPPALGLETKLASPAPTAQIWKSRPTALVAAKWLTNTNQGLVASTATQVAPLAQEGAIRPASPAQTASIWR